MTRRAVSKTSVKMAAPFVTVLGTVLALSALALAQSSTRTVDSSRAEALVQRLSDVSSGYLRKPSKETNNRMDIRSNQTATIDWSV